MSGHSLRFWHFHKLSSLLFIVVTNATQPSKLFPVFRKIVVSFTTKHATPRQIKLRILELSIRRRQSNSSTVLTFVDCEEIDRYRGDVVSAGQLGATTACTNHYFAVFFSIFELGGITKHLMTGPSGNSELCFPPTSMSHIYIYIEGLGETKLTVSLGASH